MSQKLLDVEEEVGLGAAPSLPNDRIPFWESTSNVIYYKQSVVPAPGHFSIFDRSDANPKLGLLEAEILDNTVRKRTLFSGGPSKLYRWVDGDQIETDISRSVGGAYGIGASVDQTPNQLALLWSFAQWGEWALASNGVDRLQLYKGNTAPIQRFADLVQTGGGALPFARAQIIRRLKVYAVALNTDIGPDLVHWSNTDDLFVWTPTDLNAAGSLPVRNLNSQIMAAEPLGQAGLAIYGRDQQHLMSFIGAPLTFGIDQLQDGIGAWGKAAVAAAGPYHYGWGPRGIWRTDGNQTNYIDTPALRGFLKDTLNEDQSSKIVVWPLLNYNGIVFFYPSGTSLVNNAALFFSYDNGSWWLWDFGRTCGTSGTVFNLPFTGDAIGNIFQVTEEQAPSSDLVGPLTMVPTFNAQAGIGNMGFGDFGFGGWQEGSA